MNKESYARFAWGLCALATALVIADQLFSYPTDLGSLVSTLFRTAVVLAFPIVGALIISRRPENLIGWILLVGMFFNLLGSFALDYAVYTLQTAPHSLPEGELMLWFGGGIRSLGFFSLIAFLPLLFPDGKLPTPRWRLVGWFTIAAATLASLLPAFAPINDFELRLPPIPNPSSLVIPPDLYEALSGIGPLGMGISTLLAAVSVVVRYRHAKGEQREQIKWFAYAGVFAAVVFSFLLTGMLGLPTTDMANAGDLFYLALVGFPIAVGIAVLKYHLYDIDLIIRRTLIYSILTALLVLVYFASVVVLQQIFVRITGEQQNEIVTVVSTLGIAAMFVPLRRRVQDAIDRRFYRRKYDAQQVLANFARTARDETDLNKLTDELIRVADETMKPESVSVLLKTDVKRRKEKPRIQDLPPKF